MPKTRVAEILSEAVQNGIAPLLKASRYRRNGTHYYKLEPGTLKILNVQSSQWNTADEGRFTINLGIHLEALADRREPMPDPPREEYCVLRERIGMLLPEHRDHWWRVTPSIDPDALSDELRTVCDRYALPWLDRYANPRAAAEELERMRHDWDAAAAWFLLSDVPRATRLSQQAFDQWNRHLAEYSDMESMRKRFPKSNPAQLEKTAEAERARIQQQIDRLRAWAQARNLKIG